MLSRATTSRVATSRELPDAEEFGVLHVPAELVPTNMAYKWVRLSTLGEMDDANWARATRDGWTSVPADRHPELVPPPMPGRESTPPTVIIRAGQILMERPIEKQRQYLAQQRVTNAKVLQAVDADRRVQGGDRNFVKDTDLHSRMERQSGGGGIPGDDEY